MTKQNRFLLFLYSNGNIMGSILGILGLLLFFAGIIKSFWYFIVLALYGIGVLVGNMFFTSPDAKLQFRNQMTIEEVRAELEDLIKKIRKRVPEDVLSKVERIKVSILDMLPYIMDINSADHNIYVIRQTALDYLPETLENYLNLPPAFAKMHPIKDGKTAKQLLLEQLDLLDQQMREIAQDFHSDNSQGLLIHGRFLEDTFRTAELTDW